MLPMAKPLFIRNQTGKTVTIAVLRVWLRFGCPFITSARNNPSTPGELQAVFFDSNAWDKV
jgi:hypothetical protein